MHDSFKHNSKKPLLEVARMIRNYVTLIFLLTSSISITAFALPSSYKIDPAENRLESLKFFNEGSSSGTRVCTATKDICATITGGADDLPIELNISKFAGYSVNAHLNLSDKDDYDSELTFTFWPNIIRLQGKPTEIMLGVIQRDSTMYSGGGASAETLWLFHVAPEKISPKIDKVLTVPLSGNSMIRACFSEDDYRQRAGACHDEYEFGADLQVSKNTHSTFPNLIYSTEATSFPGHVSRSRDSLEDPPLRKKDLVTVTDAHCTYQRIFSFNSKLKRYIPNAPLPDCGEYTVP